jgi:hypothetical protein
MAKQRKEKIMHTEYRHSPLRGSEGDEVTDNLRTINVAVGGTRLLEETTAVTTSASCWISLLAPLCSTYWIVSAFWLNSEQS